VTRRARRAAAQPARAPSWRRHLPHCATTPGGRRSIAARSTCCAAHARDGSVARSNDNRAVRDL